MRLSMRGIGQDVEDEGYQFDQFYCILQVDRFCQKQVKSQHRGVVNKPANKTKKSVLPNLFYCFCIILTNAGMRLQVDRSTSEQKNLGLLVNSSAQWFTEIQVHTQCV